MNLSTSTTIRPAGEVIGEAARLARTESCSITLPAGCGKTQLLAEAVLVGAHNGDHGRSQLVLTHTHAGVHAITTRLRRLKLPSEAVRVTTIAGWALRLASSYPTLSGLTNPTPTSAAGWAAVHQAATAVLSSPHLRRVLSASYSGVYVDEYQDCSIQQHTLILALAEQLPTRLLGDPMQSIFGFGGSTVVDWDRDVLAHFPPLEIASHPWRWATTNPALGGWLHRDLREHLQEGRPIDLGTAPVTWRSAGHYAAASQACSAIAELGGTAVAIHQHAAQCHNLARQLAGRFTSMEELESKDLLATADAFDTAVGDAEHVGTVLAELLAFAKRCIAKLPQALDRAVGALGASRRPSAQFTDQHPRLIRALHAVSNDPSPGNLLLAVQAIEQLPGIVVFRRELWCELQRALRIQRAEAAGSLRDAVLTARDRTRRYGRAVEPRSVSRTLLVKGLEYDHAIVLAADSLDATNLYVAMTRGRSSLTVLSTQPCLPACRLS